MSGTQIHTGVDFGQTAGKQCGHLAIPYSHNLGGWANLRVPISMIRNGAGPVMLLVVPLPREGWKAARGSGPP